MEASSELLKEEEPQLEGEALLEPSPPLLAEACAVALAPLGVTLPLELSEAEGLPLLLPRAEED